MNVKKVPVTEALGHVLLHNHTGPDGRKAVKKGVKLSQENIATLQSLGYREVYIAILEAGDINENEAAHRLADMLDFPDINRSSATTGRVNFTAAVDGVFKVNTEALLALNEVAGITLATIPTNTPVTPKKLMGTLKVIPYAVPTGYIQKAATIISDNQPLFDLRPFTVKQAVLITTGSENSRQNVIDGFTSPIRERLASYHTDLIEGPFVAEAEDKISQALKQALDSRAEMIIIAGETSIMDADDITPRAIKAVGGEIVHYGVPVEPGNLFMLAYHGDKPIVGAPGCARSKSYNVVDMVLPRLAAGERLTRQDLIELGHGGYLR